MGTINGEKIFDRKIENVFYVEIDTKKTFRNKTISSILEIDADIFYFVEIKEGSETLDINEARFWKTEEAALAAAKRIPGSIARARSMSTRDFVNRIKPPERKNHVTKKTLEMISTERKYLKEFDELMSNYKCDPEFYKIPDNWHKWLKCKNCGHRPLICLNACPATGCGCMDGDKHYSVIVYPPKFTFGKNGSGSNRDSELRLRNEWNKVNQ